MSGFILRAVPDIVPAGRHKGYLAYVIFFATDGKTTYRWFSTNCDRYVPAFAELVGWPTAIDIHTKLCRGENASFPGEWSLEFLDRTAFLGLRSK
jgi:hypothetical protein